MERVPLRGRYDYYVYEPRSSRVLSEYDRNPLTRTINMFDLNVNNAYNENYSANYVYNQR